MGGLIVKSHCKFCLNGGKAGGIHEIPYSENGKDRSDDDDGDDDVDKEWGEEHLRMVLFSVWSAKTAL